MAFFNAMAEQFEEITVCGKPALFTSIRLDRILSRIVCMLTMSGMMMTVRVSLVRSHPMCWSITGAPSSLQSLWNCRTMVGGTSTRKTTGTTPPFDGAEKNQKAVHHNRRIHEDLCEAEITAFDIGG